jgi:hypothetical protein
MIHLIELLIQDGVTADGVVLLLLSLLRVMYYVLCIMYYVVDVVDVVVFRPALASLIYASSSIFSDNFIIISSQHDEKEKLSKLNDVTPER